MKRSGIRRITKFSERAFGKIACSALLAIGLSACPASQSHNQRENISVPEKVPVPIAEKVHVPACNLEKGILTYSRGGLSKSLDLDVDLEEADSVICSKNYTVMIKGSRAYISLGEDDVLDGDEMFGSLSGRFVVANSYSLSIEGAQSEGINGMSVEGNVFIVDTNEGQWSTDLSDPQSWDIERGFFKIR
jgi:hypothetical protein